MEKCYSENISTMKSPQPAKNTSNKAKMIFLLCLVIVAIFGSVIWYVFMRGNIGNGDKKATAPEYFGSYEQLNSVPSRTDVPTNDPGILVAWMDQRVIDGNLSCTIYRKDDRRVLAVYVKTSGFNPEHRISSHTDYKDSDVSKSAIDQITKDYCEAKQ
jgi:hypothetical protein